MRTYQKAIAGVASLGIVGVFALAIAHAKRKTFDFEWLGEHRPISVERTSRGTQHMYSFPCRYFDLRKRAEKEMADRGFRTMSRPQDTGRWWDKDNMSIGLDDTHTSVESGRIVGSEGGRKWVTVNAYVSRESGWFDLLFERIFPRD